MSRVHAPRPRPVTLVLTSLLLAPALAACGAPQATEPPTGKSNLAPSFDAGDGQQDRGRAGKQDDQRTRDQRKRTAKGGERSPAADESRAAGSGDTAVDAGAESASTTAGSGGSSGGSGSEADPTPTHAGPLRASAGDPTGDVSGGLADAPDHVDLVGATVTRTASGFEVRVDVAGPLPARMEGSRTQNVAIFYDLDGDGNVDHETWGALSDNGWTGSYRTPSSARYGSDSGVQVQPEGDTLVLAFPLSHLAGARRFDWQFGSEWGTYEQVASGTTAVDRAAEGGVAFPG